MSLGSRSKRWLIAIGAVFGAIVLVVSLWDWNWFRPIVEARASAALKRPVTIANLDVDLSWLPLITLSGVAVGNPPDFPPDTTMATVEQLGVRVDLRKLIRGTLRFPELTILRPQARLQDGPSGKGNWDFSDDDGKAETVSSAAMPEIGILTIRDGDIRLSSRKLEADLGLVINTENEGGAEPTIVATGDGRYAGEPFKLRFRGGSVVSLQDQDKPYPIDAEAQIGTTRSSIKGTVVRAAEKGAIKADLVVAGPDLAKLYPLIGIPIPPTPPFRLEGTLEQDGHTFRFTDFKGKVGDSDLAGNLVFQTGNQRPYLEADLVSRKVVLNDLKGFLGALPDAPASPTAGKPSGATSSVNAADRSGNPRAGNGRGVGGTSRGDAGSARPERAAAGEPRRPDPRADKILPDTTINLEAFRSLDAKVRYRGERIDSEHLPLDNLQASLTLESGRLKLEPLSFGVGSGRISGTIDLDGRNEIVLVMADVDFRNLDLKRIMQQTGFEGLGRVGGRLKFQGRGNSTAAMLATADGDLKLFMGSGQFSSLLVELIGLDAAEALGFALSRDRKVTIRCLVADFGVQKGVMQARALVFDTTDTNIVGEGTLNLRDETLNLRLTPAPKDMSILTARAPIDVSGTFADPSVLPDLAVVGARVGAAVVLGALLTPLAALIPSIELGLGEDSDCKGLIGAAERSGNAPAKAPAAPAPPARR